MSWEEEARLASEKLERAVAQSYRDNTDSSWNAGDGIALELSALREQLATMTRILGVIADHLEKNR